MQTNITGVCGECSQCLCCTGFDPVHSACAFPVYTSQALGCSAGELSEVGPGLRALPRSKPLRFRFLGTPQRHTRLGLRFVPFPGPSSSGDQVLGERSLPQVGGRSDHLPHPSCWVFWVSAGTPSQVCHMSLLGS